MCASFPRDVWQLCTMHIFTHQSSELKHLIPPKSNDDILPWYLFDQCAHLKADIHVRTQVGCCALWAGPRTENSVCH